MGRRRTRGWSPNGGKKGGNHLLPVDRTPPDDDGVVATGHSAASGCDDLSVNGMAGMGGLAPPSIQCRVDTNRKRFLPEEGWVSHPMKKMRSVPKGPLNKQRMAARGKA